MLGFTWWSRTCLAILLYAATMIASQGQSLSTLVNFGIATTTKIAYANSENNYKCRFVARHAAPGHCARPTDCQVYRPI